jgi:hypothetical protein
MISSNRVVGLLVLVSTLSGPEVGGAEPGPSRLPAPSSQTIDFRRDIHPLLTARCFRCHQGLSPKSGHRLDLRAELLGETNGKPLVLIGQSAQSRLIHLVSGQLDDAVMPPASDGLRTEEVALLRAWIDQGLKWDDDLLPPLTASRHWAFRPLTNPAAPQVKNAAWARNPIDAFLAQRHEAAGLAPAAEADRRTLLRRLSLDLVGLPPSPEEIDAFVGDPSPDACEKVVERLLASPHYGERWGRHWLDLARWAESEGYESNHPRPHAWRYRDYVVRCFNEDRPFRDFVREQLAGDEITPYSDEHLIATGFLGAARLSSNEEDKPRQRNDILVDMVNATGSVFLGLTLHCAQCHNHKFDPITARDYYRFQGFFLKGQPVNALLKDPDLWAAWHALRPAEYEPAKKLQEALFDAARARLVAEARKTLSAEQRRALDIPAERRTPEEEKLAREAELKVQFTPQRIERAIGDDDRKLYDELKKKIETIEKKLPDRPQTFAFYSPATSPTKVEVLPMKGFYPLPYEPKELARARPYLLVGGDVHRRGPEVDVGWPAVLGPTPPGIAAKTPRLALAEWLTDPRHPLTWRVYVNRVWQHHLGRGLVATPNDFGVKGAPPTHPELLDWLASEFLRSGGSTKHLHRLIVCSATYRQASQGTVVHPADPENALLARWEPRRLESEVIRDSMLAVSGEIDLRPGGPSSPDDGKHLRRSLYLYQRRDHPPPLQALFDGPVAAAESCPRRHVSTVPLQALYMLNNEFAMNRATALARRVQAQAGTGQEQRIDLAFRLALGRWPDAVERDAARTFFARHRGENPSAQEPAALVLFCQALLNVNEFVYLE